MQLCSFAPFDRNKNEVLHKHTAALIFVLCFLLNNNSSGIVCPSPSAKKCCITHIDHPRCVTLFEVIQHSGLVEVGHHGHVLDLVELGRVHGEDFIILHCYNL